MQPAPAEEEEEEREEACIVCCTPSQEAVDERLAVAKVGKKRPRAVPAGWSCLCGEDFS